MLSCVFAMCVSMEKRLRATMLENDNGVNTGISQMQFKWSLAIAR